MRWSEPGDRRRTRPIAATGLLCLFMAFALCLFSGAGHAAAVTQAQVSTVDGTIQSAFVSVHNAEASGGDVSSLVAQLNSAVQLVQKAETENATNPAQATADLANASSIANRVVTDAGPVGQQGASERQLQLYVSAGSAAVIVAVAALVYGFGDRIYRRAWLGLYGNHVVKRVG